MQYAAYQSRLSQLSARFNLMVCLVFGLLFTNVILAGLLFHFMHQHTVEITPFFGDSYFKTANRVDARYLSLMTENFIYSRLNVTPETVEAHHQRLLQFVDSKNYPQMLKVLEHEAQIIKTQKISSIFLIKNIKVNPDTLTAIVNGILQPSVGLRSLKEEQLNYHLQFAYHQGGLSIISFKKEPTHV